MTEPIEQPSWTDMSDEKLRSIAEEGEPGWTEQQRRAARIVLYGRLSQPYPQSPDSLT